MARILGGGWAGRAIPSWRNSRLVGLPTNLSELFAPEGASSQLTAGIAIATLDGLDWIVFCGRHASAAAM